MKMKECLPYEVFLKKLKERHGGAAQEAPVKLGYNYGPHSYIRSIAEIGRFLSPAKPIGPVTVLRLIRRYGLPAKKSTPGGWMVRVKDLVAWAETFTGGASEEHE